MVQAVKNDEAEEACFVHPTDKPLKRVRCFILNAAARMRSLSFFT